MRVLIDRVVPGVEGEHANRIALRFGDLIRTDHTRRVTRPGGRNRAVVRGLRRSAEGNDGRTTGKHWKRNYRALVIVDLLMRDSLLIEDVRLEICR